MADGFEPQKFFIGLLDFFTVLLPGMLLTYVVRTDMCTLVFKGGCPASTTTEGLGVFLVASYLVGHVIFLLGAWWLDELYDVVRRLTVNGQVERVVRWNSPSPWPVRLFAWLLFKREENRAVTAAAAIRRQMLQPLRAQESVNTFQWSKALLVLESADALATVNLFEAHSKFFRSFVVVLIVLIIVWTMQGRELALVGWATALLTISFWRYADQRLKSTNQAYWSVITLTAKKGGVTITPPVRNVDGATHAGGVVYRGHGQDAEYLLIEASKNAQQWVLPKGHIEDGEDAPHAAVREVHEETGVWARLHVDLGKRALATESGSIQVQFYLMEKRGSGFASDPYRRHRWLPLSKAQERANFDETRELLAMADQRRRAIENENAARRARS